MSAQHDAVREIVPDHAAYEFEVSKMFAIAEPNISLHPACSPGHSHRGSLIRLIGLLVCSTWFEERLDRR